MAKRAQRRSRRRFHWIAADHTARLRYLLDQERFKDHDLYSRVVRDEIRAIIKGAAPLPLDHPFFEEPISQPNRRA